MILAYIQHVKLTYRSAKYYYRFPYSQFMRHINPIRFYFYHTDPIIVAAKKAAKRPTLRDKYGKVTASYIDTSPEAVACWKLSATYSYGSPRFLPKRQNY